MLRVEAGEPLFELHVVRVQEVRQYRRLKFFARDARVLERPLVVFLERLELRADQAPNALRGLHRLIGDRLLKCSTGPVTARGHPVLGAH